MAKIGSQHDILHREFPDNCCLCTAEQRATEAEKRFDYAMAALRQIEVERFTQAVFYSEDGSPNKCAYCGAYFIGTNPAWFSHYSRCPSLIAHQTILALSM